MTDLGSQNYPDIVERLTEIGLFDVPELLSETTDLFVNDSRSVLEQLRKAAAAGDAQTVSRSAHRLKGAALNLGVATIAVAAKSVEERAREGDLTNVAGVADNIGAELNSVAQFLRGLVQKALAGG